MGGAPPLMPAAVQHSSVKRSSGGRFAGGGAVPLTITGV